MNDNELYNESIKLLQELIKNKCVNPPGNEMKSIRTIESFLKKKGISCEILESTPNRGNFIAKIKGTGGGKSLMFGPSHVDVVPVENPDDWSVDPFAGIIEDGFIMGRGSIDMLFIVVAQIQAFTLLHEEGFQPKGDLILLIVSDEEMGGKYGTEWLLENHPEKIKTDYAVSEMGGVNLSANKFGFMIGEKGASWYRITFTGIPSHGSVPYKTENAVVKASEAAYRLSKYRPPITTKYLKRLLLGFGYNPIIRFFISRKIFLPYVLKLLSKNNLEMARSIHSLTQMTISPNIISGGTKANTIAAKANVDIDIRTLPGQDYNYIIKHIKKALGKRLFNEATIEILKEEGIVSFGNITNVKSELCAKMKISLKKIIPNADFIPLIYPGATDLRFLRERNVEACGFAIMDPSTDFVELIDRIHGNDERISTLTLEYTIMGHYYLAKEILE